MAGTTKPTVYKWIAQYEQHGIDGLSNRVSTGRPSEVSAEVRARILALSRRSPPEETGLFHWSSREMAPSWDHKPVRSVEHRHRRSPGSLFSAAAHQGIPQVQWIRCAPVGARNSACRRDLQVRLGRRPGMIGRVALRLTYLSSPGSSDGWFC
jgi:hypothetical protein